MSFLEQVLEMVARRNETRQDTPQPDVRANRSLQYVWVVEISLASDSLSQRSNAATIYELGKPFEADSEQWELIDQQRCEVKGDAEGFCRGLLATITELGMRRGDLILVVADHQDWVDRAVREMSSSATVIGEFKPKAQAAGSRVEPSDDHGLGDSEVEHVMAAVRRVKLIEYLKRNLG